MLRNTPAIAGPRVFRADPVSNQLGIMRALFPLLLLITSGARAGLVPESDLWPIWDQGNENNPTIVDHSSWQAILNQYLDSDHSSGINRFDYAGIAPDDKAALDDYVNMLQAIDPRGYPRSEQLAYWINLYNAATVALVIDNYPVKSIRKIYGGLLGLGPWNEQLLTVAGESLTLNDIEHRILRPIWNDPRIHYAVNCASLGCPNLAANAYTAANVDILLDKGARAYINHPRGAKYQDGKLYVSSIFKWYRVDFGDSEAGVIAHLRRYAMPDFGARLATYDGKLRYDYDWELNER